MSSNSWFALIVIAVVGLAVARRMAPLFASFFGIAFAIAIGAWGYFTFARGGAFALFGALPVNQPMFYGFVALWLGLELHGLVRVLKLRAQEKKVVEALERHIESGDGT
jgi:hypothetical protein